MHNLEGQVRTASQTGSTALPSTLAPTPDLTGVIYTRDLSLSKPNPFPSHISF